jgi:preprotein translocase subunit YajC
MNALASATLAQANTPQQQPNSLLMLLPWVALALVMYLLLIRPQQRRQKQHQAMVNTLKTGDEVVTTGGLYGTVAGVDDRKNILYLKISQDVKVKVERHSVARVVTETAEPIK